MKISRSVRRCGGALGSAAAAGRFVWGEGRRPKSADALAGDPVIVAVEPVETALV